MSDSAARRKRDRVLPVLLSLLVCAAALYAWILPQRWITPDEGAHLMDGRRIILEGTPPFSIGARQPLYCGILAASQLVFGNTLLSGRIVALGATLLAGFLVFRIGRRIDDRAGLAAAALFLFSPLTLHYATVVQTQPLAILLSCLVVLLVLHGGRGAWLGAGVLIGLGFLVRESVLALAPAVILFRLIDSRNARAAARSAVELAAGYAAVCVVVLLLYTHWWSFPDVWSSRINPLYLPYLVITKALGLGANPMGGSGRTQGGPHDFRSGAEFLAIGFRFAALTLVPGIFALCGIAGRWLRGSGRRTSFLLACWAGFLALLYGGWSGGHGFQPGYVREFEPSLAILAAAAVAHASRKTTRPWWLVLPAAAGLFAAVLIQTGNFPFWLEPVTLAVCAGCGLLFFEIGQAPREAGRIAAWGGTAAALLALFVTRRPGGPLAGVEGAGLLAVAGLFVLLILFLLRVTRIGGAFTLFPSILYASIVFSVISAVEKGGFDFHGQWPPKTVAETARLVRDSTPPDGEVMSGAVIWEFLAGRRSFGNQNHPLVYLGMRNGSYLMNRVTEAWDDRPPDAIVLDGLTEKTYLRSRDVAAAVTRDYVRRAPPGEEPPVTVLVRRPHP